MFAKHLVITRFTREVTKWLDIQREHAIIKASKKSNEYCLMKYS